MKINEKLIDENIERRHRAKRQHRIHSEFCDENRVVNCVQAPTKGNHLLDGKPFALMDFSLNQGVLERLEKRICGTVNKTYKDKGGKEDYYATVACILSHCLELGIESFSDDERAVSAYIEKSEGELDDIIKYEEKYLKDANI
tara:strand:+ start:338 stop:766 length:429 start_codon:yes stop_codon:yes gene_type:complete